MVSGANALTIRVPSARWRLLKVHLSIASVVRSGAAGVSSDHTCVVPPAVLNVPAARPSEIAFHSSGTVTANRNRALSRGVSLAGYQVMADCGRPAANAPPGLMCCQPFEPGIVVGTPW